MSSHVSIVWDPGKGPRRTGEGETLRDAINGVIRQICEDFDQEQMEAFGLDLGMVIGAGMAAIDTGRFPGFPQPED